MNVCAAICVCVAAMHIYQVYIEEAEAEAVAGCHYVRRKDGAVAGKVEKWGSGVAVGGWGSVRQGSKQQKIKHAHKYTRN